MFIDDELIADGMFIVIPGGYRMLYCSIVYIYIVATCIYCPSLVFVDCISKCPGFILSIHVTCIILSLSVDTCDMHYTVTVCRYM